MPSRTIWLGLAFFTAVNACVRLEVEGRWPARGVVRALTIVGTWSYSLYLVHHPAQTIALAVMTRVVPEASVAGFIARAMVLVLISCVAGRLFFEVVERHFLPSHTRRADDGGRWLRRQVRHEIAHSYRQTQYFRASIDGHHCVRYDTLLPCRGVEQSGSSLGS